MTDTDTTYANANGQNVDQETGYVFSRGANVAISSVIADELESACGVDTLDLRGAYEAYLGNLSNETGIVANSTHEAYALAQARRTARDMVAAANRASMAAEYAAAVRT